MLYRSQLLLPHVLEHCLDPVNLSNGALLGHFLLADAPVGKDGGAGPRLQLLGPLLVLRDAGLLHLLADGVAEPLDQVCRFGVIAEYLAFDILVEEAKHD